MIPFITFRETENGQLNYYILQKAFPHFVGRISNNPYEEAIFKAPIPGYNMIVILQGSLRGGEIPNYKDVVNEIEGVMNNMAAWFYTDRIIGNEGKFKKFKIENNAAISNR